MFNMNDTVEEPISSGAGSAVQTGAGHPSILGTMPADGLNTSLVKPSIETFRLPEISEEASGSASGFQNTGEALHKTVIDAGGVHAGIQRIASGDFATPSDRDSGSRDDQDVQRETIGGLETTEVKGQDQTEEVIPSAADTQEPQVKVEESVPEAGIDKNSPAEEVAGQSEPALGFVQPKEQSVPEGDLNEDLLKLLAQITAKIEEEEDPEERVSLIEALIALIKMIIALSIKTAKEVGKDLITPATSKEI